MNLHKEPKEIDFIIESKPWTDKELEDFRKIMNKQKLSNNLKKQHITKLRVKATAGARL